MEVQLFARLRELAGAESISVTPVPASVAALRKKIAAEASPELREALEDPNVFCAVNKRVVGDEHPVADGDEVGFFPPMTGG
ncbi:MAG: MoaD/ThiS family protein [Pseudomonadota bacterium]